VIEDLARVKVPEGVPVFLNQVGQQVISGEGPTCVPFEQAQDSLPDRVAEGLCLCGFESAAVMSGASQRDQFSCEGAGATAFLAIRSPRPGRAAPRGPDLLGVRRAAGLGGAGVGVICGRKVVMWVATRGRACLVHDAPAPESVGDSAPRSYDGAEW
jgi:hypothetical protein